MPIMSDLISLSVGIAAHKRINSIKSDMRAQKLTLDESELSAVSMRQDIERLYMLVEALWLIVKEKSGINDDALAELVKQIDLQDGKLDGRNSSNATVRKCANCGRTLLRGQSKCTYCGNELHDAALFRHNGK